MAAAEYHGEPVPSGPTGTQRALARYWTAGLSVLPLRACSKAPNGLLLPRDDGDDGSATWKPYQSRLATREEITAWALAAPGGNVGIVCGSISGDLHPWDLDLHEFCAWMLAHWRPLLEKTWVVRTGSGKLHAYWRSRGSLASRAYTYKGTRLADLRGDGWYIAAPPSLHPSGGEYATLWGDPEHIAILPDALGTFELLRARFEAGAPTSVLLGSAPLPPPRPSAAPAAAAAPATRDRSIKPPLGQADKDALNLKLRKSRLSPHVREAIASGARPGVGVWTDEPDHSRIDFAVLMALAEDGSFTDLDLENVLATYPVGRHTYQDPAREGSCGRGYFLHTLGNVKARLAEGTKARGVAAGENFHVAKAVRVAAEPAFVILLIQSAHGETREVRMDMDELVNQRSFRTAVMKQHPRLVPTFKRDHDGGMYVKFVQAVIDMASHEGVPEAGTSTGYLKTRIVGLLRQIKSPPPVQARPHNGWRDDAQGLVYVRGEWLMAQVAATLKPTPGPDRVWQAVKLLGAEERIVSTPYGGDKLWLVPTRLVDPKD